MKIAVAGLGYVGLANAILLSQHNAVVGYDICREKIVKLKQKISPIKDTEIEMYLKEKELKLSFTDRIETAVSEAQYLIIATPTNYDSKTNSFNTDSVEETAKKAIACRPSIVIIIKSTVPIGFTERLKNLVGTSNIIFSPEFLREGRALYDNLYPSRIVIGGKTEHARTFARMLQTGALKENIPIVFTSSTEAEAIKLFANTFLAMRIAFFNELDTYAESKGLSSKEIIEGISLDPRIGNYYNNPSFGYGGYCLPKDSKQLLANYEMIPNELITATVKANETRKRFIALQIEKRKPKIVGVYRLVMKSGSDNFRESSVFGIIAELVQKSISVIIYEPAIGQLPEIFVSCDLVNDLYEFKRRSDLIIANRYNKELFDVKGKLYTRDIFQRD